MLRILDTYWDVVCFAVPPTILLGAASVAAVVSVHCARRGLDASRAWAVVALGAVTVALSWVVAILLGVIVRPLVSFVARRPGGRFASAPGLQQVLATEWSVRLLHVPGLPSRDGDNTGTIAERVSALLDAAREHPDGQASPHPVIVPDETVTTSSARDALGEAPVQELMRTPLVRVAWRAGDGPLNRPAQGRLPLRDVAFLLGSSLTVLAIAAVLVADAERQKCAGNPAAAACEGRPATFATASYWLLNRLFGGDPDSLGAATVFGRVVAVLTTIFGVIVLVRIINDVFTQLIQDTLNRCDQLVEGFNSSLPAGTGPQTRPNLISSSASSRLISRGIVLLALAAGSMATAAAVWLARKSDRTTGGSAPTSATSTMPPGGWR